jgi:hypothetical protein
MKIDIWNILSLYRAENFNCCSNVKTLDRKKLGKQSQEINLAESSKETVMTDNDNRPVTVNFPNLNYLIRSVLQLSP